MADVAHSKELSAESAPAVKTPPTDITTDAPVPQEEPSNSEDGPVKPTATATTSTNTALTARIARFKALQAAGQASKKSNSELSRNERVRPADEKDEKDEKDKLAHLRRIQDQNAVKIIKDQEGDMYERKRAWDYSIEESESWDKRVKKKKLNRENNAFSDWRTEANKNYKRQLKQMGPIDLDAYLASKAQKLQAQVSAGLLELVETEDGDVFTIDQEGRKNTPVDEGYTHDHKPSKDAIDRLVGDLEKGERARLKARAARGLDNDDSGDVTYINQKNKQFNEKLARFYNKYTTEIRESFERGTAI